MHPRDQIGGVHLLQIKDIILLVIIGCPWPGQQRSLHEEEPLSISHLPVLGILEVRECPTVNLAVIEDGRVQRGTGLNKGLAGTSY